MVSANIGMMMFIFLNHFMNKQDRWIYSIGVGVYFSVIYGKSLLFYILIYVMIMLLGAFYERLSSFTFIETLIFVELMIAIKEFLIYLLMIITQVTNYPIYLFASNRLGPTLLLNAAIFIPAYYFFKIYKHIVNGRGYDGVFY